MTPPVLVTPPSGPVVPLLDLREQCRMDPNDNSEDLYLEALERSAVAYLDGWKGVLGRAILPQVWRQEFAVGEVVRLMMPDVTAVTVTAYNDAGAEVTVTHSLALTFRGWEITVTGSYARLRVDYTCGMAAGQIDAARQLVRQIVAHWYRNRESVLTGTIATKLPMAAESMITAIRWIDA